MKSIRKLRPSYIIVVASAAQLSLTGCHSNVNSNRKPSCEEKYDPSTCPTVNPAPVFNPEDLEKSCEENNDPAICPTVNPPPPPDLSKEGFIHQFDFDTLSIELVGGLSPDISGEMRHFTIKKDALNPKQSEILKSLYAVTDLTKLSCAADVEGIAYKMVLHRNQSIIHNIMSNDGYCLEARALGNVTFVEATALRNFYLTKP